MPEDVSRHDRKLEFILGKAARIFAEKSYHSSSMRDISRATGVSLSGLYHYCKSKEELLFLIQENCFGRVLERLQERLGDTADPVERLRVFIENHLAFFASNMAEMKVLSHEAESLQGQMREDVSLVKQKYTKLARSILGDIQNGDGPGVDLTVATYALFGMINWIYNWYDPDGKLAITELVESMTQLFLTGFLDRSSVRALELMPSPSPEPLNIWRASRNDERRR
jgi:AcrR family transcriptional regulator